jgi:phosphate:Na+ symporter
VLRDLKRIHSHICSVAYPILEATGELQPSRLRSLDAEAETLRGTAAVQRDGFTAPRPR